MMLFHLVVFIAALALGIGYVCRLNLLSWRKHKPSVIALHVALFALSASAAYHAFYRITDLQDVASVVVGYAWFFMSYPSWKLFTPPEHSRRHAGDHRWT